MNISDPNSLLSTSQKQMLIYCSNLFFQLEQFDSLDNILTDLDVDVIIEPGIKTRQIPSNLDAAINYWREETIRLENLIHDEESNQEYLNALKNSRNLQNSIDKWESMPLRGLYDPKSNVIKLYPEEMRREYNCSRMEELLISTLAHETMHAFFNRPGHKNFPYIIFVEEPLAEFGMLLFLNETRVVDYNWAYNDVKNKKTCYSYGALLMDQYITGGQPSVIRQYLENYKIKLNMHAMPSILNSGISMPPPTAHGSKKIMINGQIMKVSWKDAIRRPPRYFYDKATQTLGLDGDWSDGRRRYHRGNIYIDTELRIFIDIDMKDIQTIYLGDNFIDDSRLLCSLFSMANVVVSSRNHYYIEKNGIPIFKMDNTPFLLRCGNDMFVICRNGLFGLVNMQGSVQVPVIYEHITNNNDGTYTVKQHGQEFVIDKNGKRISAPPYRLF